MARVLRFRTVEICGEGDEEVIEVRLKKWSFQKLLFLVRESWSFIEDGLNQALEGGKLKEMTMVEIARIVIGHILQAEKKAAQIVCESVVRPESLKPEDVLEWDADDFVRVVTEIVEMNVTEELIKNYRRLLTTFVDKASRSRKSKTRSGPQPVSSGA